tara:strand:+ start:54 stop:377 length:324 start_codon:yes stop_codon:yes gene_type:complete
MAKVTIADKAKKAGLPVQVVYNRMHAGWTEKKALSVPKQQYKKRKVAYKVEPKKVLTPRSTVKPVEKKVPPTIPLPVEKYEAPKDKTLLYVVVACVVILVLAVITNT